MILAIDPGTTQSGFVLFDPKTQQPHEFGKIPNEEVIRGIAEGRWAPDLLAVEMIQSYGMPIGRETMETILWLGEMIHAWRRMTGERAVLVYRKNVCSYLCRNGKASDANIRQALIDRYPPTGGGKLPQVGIKSAPGPLYGFSGDAWQALAVAFTAAFAEEEDGTELLRWPRDRAVD
jgi:hypothetical protein